MKTKRLILFNGIFIILVIAISYGYMTRATKNNIKTNKNTEIPSDINDVKGFANVKPDIEKAFGKTFDLIYNYDNDLDEITVVCTGWKACSSSYFKEDSYNYEVLKGVFKEDSSAISGNLRVYNNYDTKIIFDIRDYNDSDITLLKISDGIGIEELIETTFK